MKLDTDEKRELTISIIAAILVILQPIIWWFMWNWLAEPLLPQHIDKDGYTPNAGLTLVCIGSCIGAIILILWLRGYIVKGEDPWAD